MREVGVAEEWFFERTEKNLFNEIIEHRQKYGELPKWKTASSGMEIIAEESFDYYLDALRSRYLGSRISNGLEGAAKALQERDPDLAVSDLQSVLRETRPFTGAAQMGRVVSMADTIEKRLERYERAKNAQGVIGVPTPWQALTAESMGWQPGDFGLVLGRPGIGKTFTALILAEKAWREGVTPLFCSLEMSIAALQTRFDAIALRLPFRDLRRGQLSSQVEERYRDQITSYIEEKPIHFAGDGQIRSTMDVEMLVDEYQPGIVFVDGLYLIPAKGKALWERITEVSHDLKAMGLRKKLPVVGTTQFNRDVKRWSLKGTGDAAAFSDALLQDADVGLGLFQSEDMWRNREMLHRILKIREGEQVNYLVKWDLVSMNFEQIEIVSEKGEPLASEEAVKAADEEIPF